MVQDKHTGPRVPSLCDSFPLFIAEKDFKASCNHGRDISLSQVSHRLGFPPAPPNYGCLRIVYGKICGNRIGEIPRHIEPEFLANSAKI
jgi:hypothetical protein